MGYFEGIELANLRFDAAVQAKCDPEKGWKREGDKCVRVKKRYGKGVAHGILGTVGASTAANLAAVGVASHRLNKYIKENPEAAKEMGLA
jgi:hypothetical protein